MVPSSKIHEVLNGYDKENIVVGTIGSHTALQILKGARDEGLKNLVICKNDMKKIYERFGVADEIITVENFRDILNKEFQKKLVEKNVVLVPHGSFVEYIGAGNITEKLSVPTFGSRNVLEWEADRKKTRIWFDKAGVRMPHEFKSPEEIDRLAIVKFYGAKGGAGYFLAANQKEFDKRIGAYKMQEYTIQEYVIGTRFYPHFFYSPAMDRVELLGIDIRYESNADGLTRVPPNFLIEHPVDVSYTVTGNIPVVVRESLLPKIFDIGERLIAESKKLFGGIVGPFCVEMMCTKDLEFIAFEISSRIVAGTNLYVDGSPYSSLLFNEPMSTGRRIAREIKMAGEKGMLEKIFI